jgi:uncharacterized protein (UPF0332 family)
VLIHDDAWAFAHALSEDTESSRRCKTNRLYYAAFHHARVVVKIKYPDRHHKAFWGALNTSTDGWHRRLAGVGRLLLDLREKADYHVSDDFTHKDAMQANSYARQIEKYLLVLHSTK